MKSRLEWAGGLGRLRLGALAAQASRGLVVAGLLLALGWRGPIASAANSALEGVVFFGKGYALITAEAGAVLSEVVQRCGREARYSVVAYVDPAEVPEELAEEAFLAAEHLRALAKRRIDVVVASLVAHGVEPTTVSTGIEDIEAGARPGDPFNRRVSIKCEK